MSNAGAHGGLLQEVSAGGFSYVGEDPPYWVDLLALGVWPTTDIYRPRLVMPTAAEAGDVETIFLHASLQPAGGTIQEIARQVGGLSGFRVGVQWTFVTTRGLPVSWRFLPSRLRRHRKTVRRSTEAEIDASKYRQAVLDQWRGQEQYVQYAEIAEGAAGA